MTDPPDYYAILGVGRDATRQDISHAYRALMRSHHPDMDGARADGDGGGGAQSKADKPAKNVDPGQGDQLLRIMQAFNVLGDPERRAAYDRKLAAPAPTIIPVRKVRSTRGPSGPVIRITPVRWESGPWA
ncbi:DnaJ domain-containing protein [Arthrobacter sp. FW306-05-C]|uniref:DnaJ domain-containing protein n=1 Tax=Arthrobacter TaxID=1663 RepID=UPI001EF0C798|nr:MULTISPECIES: DnaJ domain-containing protein [Arthrobacter]MDP9985430.1 DnaJ-class molecular chaperone [Arthrobacter oryzae]UKA66225.1 DnaJ domain-containing protein [Arthrobacter sp. FW306-05-C]UKA70573.1 DnaJ domain-containing protein [Arthrobacter sp. FW306-06-A]